ncbi:MAG: FAD-binding oxidoreductase [Actinomycetota bacterium]
MDIGAVLDELRAALPAGAVSVAPAVLAQHGTDESWHVPVPPDAVVFPSSTQEVAAIVRACAAHRVPVVAFGAGTGLEGHVAALRGGICIDTQRMGEILEVNVDDLDCLVQAGVRRQALNERLRGEGLFFPVDPGADATIGGMAATRASGTTTVRYGTMRDNVMGLTVVTAGGQVIHTGSRARKSSAGYDLTRLFVGSEGTLGVITEVRLRVYGVPESIAAAVCGFPSLEGAVRTAIQTIQMGIPVARIELLNEIAIHACNLRSGLGLNERPTLFLEFHGSEPGVRDQSGAAGEIAASNGGDGFVWTADQGERERLWAARHQALYAALALRPGAKAMGTDVCVPISRLAECMLETEKDLTAAGVPAPIVGHVGDGNFHVLFLFDPNDAAELAKQRELHERMVERALAMGGTCTGEHGIGHGKLDFMRREHDSLATMTAIKRALDPDGIMNPGKVLPPVKQP